MSFVISLLENINLHEADENNLEFDGSILVKKRGRTTGDTTGKLVSSCMYVCVHSTQVPGRYYEFQIALPSKI